jgi:hypothetical protein
MSTTTTAPSKKRASSSSSSTPENDSLALTKSIINIKKQQESFEKSVNECKKLIEDHLEDLELKTTAKRKAMVELDEDYESKKKTKRIELDQEIRAYGYQEALKIIKEHKEVAISEADLAKLNKELQELKQNRATEMAEVLRQEKEKYEKEMKTFQTTSDLRHQTEVATQAATIKQLQNHIQVLEKQTQSLQQDIEKQRELTKNVAESSRPQYYPVSSGNRN